MAETPFRAGRERARAGLSHGMAAVLRTHGAGYTVTFSALPHTADRRIGWHHHPSADYAVLVVRSAVPKATSVARATISTSSPSAHSATREAIAAGTTSLMSGAAGMS
ncbi:hypothetical protein SFIMM107S_00027 [Streptomyces griseus]